MLYISFQVIDDNEFFLQAIINYRSAHINKIRAVYYR